MGQVVASAHGSVGAMSLATGQTSTSPGQTESVLFFTDLTSDGLNPQLMVHASIQGGSTPPTTGDLATLTASSTNNNGNAGAAIVADADGGYVYFGSFDGIYRIACNITACGQPELFVPGASATALAFDGAFLYYGDQSGGTNGAPGSKKNSQVERLGRPYCGANSREATERAAAMPRAYRAIKDSTCSGDP